MKKMIVCMMVLCLLVAGGCLESLALIGGGAAGGMTAARIIQQQKEANQANIDLMEQQEADEEAELAAATDEAEKKKIQERLDNTRTVLADLRAQKIVLDGLDLGTKTDWSDPQAVIPTITAILMMVLAERERRRKNKAKSEAKENKTALVEVVAGGQMFKKTADATAITAFKKAQTEAQKTTKTKELVAILRV